ncbi:acyltransferase family protein [Vibrio fluvialis]|uniref:acyltransferase family protein n=1 Tax=Vibrio fluvialis TaxID=676 RepID=UPI001EEB2143|nr:acyltransferase [Vibrio fluvialis]
MNKVRSVHYIRGVAALLVMLIHWSEVHHGGDYYKHVLRLDFTPQTSATSVLNELIIHWKVFASNFWLINFNFAALGVLLFFLVSGFVITISVEGQNVLGFAIKRFFRLFPVLWFYIAMCIVFQKVLTAIGYPAGTDFTDEQIFSNALLVSDWMWLPFFDMGFWTLHTEVKFYIVMALFTIMVKQFSWENVFSLALLITIIALPISFLGTPNDFDVLYNNESNFGLQTLFYIFTVIGNNARFLVFMLIGSIFYLWYTDRISIGKTFVLIFVMLFLCVLLQTIAPNGLSQGYYIPDYIRAVIFFFFSIFIEKKCAHRVQVLRCFSKPLSVIGDTSYTMYLFHGLFGMTLISVVHSYTSNVNFSLLVSFIIVVPIIWFTHRYVERFSIKLGHKLAELCNNFSVKVFNT